MKPGQFCSLTIMFFLSNPLPAQSTTIVAIWTPTQIVIAADSLGRQGGRLGNATRSTCKIIQTPDIFYAMAGIPEDPETGFFAHDIVVEAARSPGKLIDKVNQFEKMVLPGLRRALENIKRRYPASYQEDFAGKPGIDIVFAGIENHALAMVVKRIGLEDFAEAGAVRQYEAQKVPSDFDAVYIGQNEGIQRFEQQNPNWWQEGRRDLIKSARSLVEVEISDAPHTVGPPIDILSIDLSGHQWIEIKPQCRERKEIGKD